MSADSIESKWSELLQALEALSDSLPKRTSGQWGATVNAGMWVYVAETLERPLAIPKLDRERSELPAAKAYVQAWRILSTREDLQKALRLTGLHGEPPEDTDRIAHHAYAEKLVRWWREPGRVRRADALVEALSEREQKEQSQRHREAVAAMVKGGNIRRSALCQQSPDRRKAQEMVLSILVMATWHDSLRIFCHALQTPQEVRIRRSTAALQRVHDLLSQYYPFPDGSKAFESWLWLDGVDFRPGGEGYAGVVLWRSKGGPVEVPLGAWANGHDTHASNAATGTASAFLATRQQAEALGVDVEPVGRLRATGRQQPQNPPALLLLDALGRENAAMVIRRVCPELADMPLPEVRNNTLSQPAGSLTQGGPQTEPDGLSQPVSENKRVWVKDLSFEQVCEHLHWAKRTLQERRKNHDSDYYRYIQSDPDHPRRWRYLSVKKNALTNPSWDEGKGRIV